MGKRWADEEVETLKQLNEDGYTREEISLVLERSQKSINLKMNRLQIKSSEVAKSRKEPHYYKVGQQVNGLKIIDCIRVAGRRTYTVQSLTYPKAPTYEIYEYSLKSGVGDAYVNGNRIFEGNSLWSKIEYRKYIVDIKQAKTIAPYHNKPIKLKCPGCNKEKNMSPSNLLRYCKLVCSTCSKGTSYPELFFMSYLEAKGIEYEYQISDLLNGRIFDFKITINGVVYLIETHGLGHYDDQVNSGVWDYEETKKSDADKRNFCKNNDINLIELDCRKSSFNFIENSINSNKVLLNITKEDRIKILEIMEQNNRYPIEEITEFYNKGESTIIIGKRYKLSHVTIGNILKKNNVKLRVNLTSVICLNTGETFESIVDASKWCGLKSAWGIGAVCRSERNYAGKHPETGEKLTWEFVD